MALKKKKKNKSTNSEQATDPQERDVDFDAVQAGTVDSDDTPAGENDDVAPESVSDDDIEAEQMRQQLETYKAEAALNHDKYLRSLAEFENFKKRSLKEKSELLKYQGEKVFVDILEIADDLDRAFEHASEDPDTLKAGVEMIRKKFVDLLGKWGVAGEASIGTQFDPTRHNAISRVKVEDAEPGSVINELCKAYYYKDKLIRPADVVVADGSPESPSGQENA